MEQVSPSASLVWDARVLSAAQPALKKAVATRSLLGVRGSCCVWTCLEEPEG